MRMTNPRRIEGGFTIVEALIGAIIVTTVLAGAMYYFAGAGKSQQGSVTRQRMSSMADRVTQKVRSDRAWLTSAGADARVCLKQLETAAPTAAPQACDLSEHFRAQVAVRPGEPKVTLTVKITPIDGEGDGIRPDDRDNIFPDYYSIVVRVELAQSEQERFGRQEPLEVVSTVDAMALGRATGSLVVQTCEVVNQVDERESISGCIKGKDGDRHLIHMKAQPEPCRSPFPLSLDDWINRRPVLDLQCNRAFNEAKQESEALTALHTRPVDDVSFTITRVNEDGSLGYPKPSKDADKFDAKYGNYSFSGLLPGTYRLDVKPGANRELWKTHTVPTAGIANVQSNQQARALVFVRPKQGIGEYRMFMTRTIYRYRLGTFTRTTKDGPSCFGGSCVTTYTQYTYLHGLPPTTEKWGGPAWNAIIALEAKPYDRYRLDPDPKNPQSGVVQQHAMPVAWAAENTDGLAVFREPYFPLATGLHSLPKQQPDPSPAAPPIENYYGSLGKREKVCHEDANYGHGDTQCSPDTEFMWIAAHGNGRADSHVRFHSDDGECYLESSVPGYSFAMRLQLGGDELRRCSRDFIYVSRKDGSQHRITDFLPKKDGSGGKTMVLSTKQWSVCSGSGCSTGSSSGSIGYPSPVSSGPGTSVTSTGGTPGTPSVSTSSSKISVSCTCGPKNSTVTKSLPAAAALPSANAAGGGGGGNPFKP